MHSSTAAGQHTHHQRQRLQTGQPASAKSSPPLTLLSAPRKGVLVISYGSTHVPLPVTVPPGELLPGGGGDGEGDGTKAGGGGDGGEGAGTAPPAPSALTLSRRRGGL